MPRVEVAPFVASVAAAINNGIGRRVSLLRGVLEDVEAHVAGANDPGNVVSARLVAYRDAANYCRGPNVGGDAAALLLGGRGKEGECSAVAVCRSRSSSSSSKR